MVLKIRILFIIVSISIAFGQTPEELKRFMDTYDKIKVDQQANEVVKKGIQSEKDPEERPVQLLVEPGDMTKYYWEKMNVIKKDLDQLNRILNYSDSIPPLTHFGYNYFSLRDSIEFIDNANVSSNYILGYGDEVIVSVWGQAEEYVRKILERDGTIFIDNVGLLYLGGKTQSEAKAYVVERFSKVYATLNSTPQLTFLEFSIGKIKNINISVAGHVQYPGNYVVNPSISISNILILAGGISNTGTLRKIYIQRGSTLIDTLDLYPLITGVGTVARIPIFEGDIIVVPPRGETIAITGDILNPAYFEIQAGEKISSALKYAGKIDNNNPIIIARPQARNLYVQYSDFKTINLMHGDSLIVPNPYKPVRSISISVTNRSIISIPWINNITFMDILIFMSLDVDNVSDVELIRRSNNSNYQEPIPFDYRKSRDFSFMPNDHLSIQLREKYTPPKTVVIKGDVYSPGTYPIINNKESILSVIERAGGLLGTTNMNNVTVKRDTLMFGSSSGNLLLTPGDTILVKPLVGTVRVEGEVHKAGNFEWVSNYSARNYLEFAGGLNAYGDKKHIIYITPYGEASRITLRSKTSVLPGSIIRVSPRPLAEQQYIDRFQQISSLVTSLVSIAILANTTK